MSYNSQVASTTKRGVFKLDSNLVIDQGEIRLLEAPLMQHIMTQTANNSASIAFTNLSSSYSRYIFYVYNLSATSGSVRLNVRYSIDGSTYLASGYVYQSPLSNSGTVTTGAPAISSFKVFAVNDVNNMAFAMFNLYNPAGTNNYKMIEMTYGIFDAGWIRGDRTVGINKTTTAPLTGVQFSFNGASIATGSFAMYGVR